MVFENIPFSFYHIEDSGNYSRIYLLLIAHTSTGLKFGKDWLYTRKLKKRRIDSICEEVVRKVVDGLDEEIRRGRRVDEHLQDQLVVFQALAEGGSCIREYVEGKESGARGANGEVGE